MKEEQVQIILITQHDYRINFARKNLQNLNENLKVLVGESLTDAIPYFANETNIFSLIVIMSGNTHFEIFNDDFIKRVIEVNNRKCLNLKILIIQPFITGLLNKLNNNTIEYVRNNIIQFKSVNLLSIFDSDYNNELNLISLN